MKRALVLFLAVTMMLPLLSACSGTTGPGSSNAPVSSTGPNSSPPSVSSADTPSSTNTAESDAPREIDIACVRFTMHVDWDQMYVWQKHYEDTGIKINWTYIPADGRNEQKNLMIATRDYPDAFWGCHWTMPEMMQYVRDGIFVPIDEYLPEYGPNITRLYNDDPLAKSAQTMPDGHIYSYGQIATDYSVGNGVALRKGWIEKLGLEYPETTDELMDVMMAMKTDNPNGLGAGEVFPLSDSLVDNPTGVVDLFLGAWGLANRGLGTNRVFDADPNDPAKLRNYVTDERYREVLQYVREMEVNGLIDPQIYYRPPAENGVNLALPDNETRVGVTSS